MAAAGKGTDIAAKFGVRQCSPWDAYDRRNALGEGGFSKIYRVRHRHTSKQYAIKVLDKAQKHSRDTFFVEVKLLTALDHKNIISVYETFEDKHAYYIVLELMHGKDLFDVLDAKRDVFPEATAAKLIRSMADAVRFCHDRNIVHLDLKPENFVFARSDDIDRLVLVDFGLGRLVRPDAHYRDRVGSMQYIAPEMIDENSVCTGTMLKACDMWSLGVILYILVTGLIPFSNWDEVKTGRLRLSKSMSKELRDLLKSLLTRDTFKRITAAELLTHPWLAMMEDIGNNPMYKAVRAGAAFLTGRKKATSPMLVALIDALKPVVLVEDRHELEGLVAHFDADNDGVLNDDEFASLLSDDSESGPASLSAIKKALTMLPNSQYREEAGFTLNDLVLLAAVGMLILNTSSSRKRVGLAVGQKKPRGMITKGEVEHTLRSVDTATISAVFREAPVQERRKVLPVDVFVAAVLDR
ncbi:unnamed protein product (mitochondrion) [Plasmodiophora brassicae]|uniref:non-specific serine/threonine protein kinase n=1 Tax=Plasmodiophora brassicae TaxID=37360 RepID=A0A0G4J7D2_PLABS|nr:hypothetical protein PBRA_003024 [Plasmodiophora brassicae]SPQ95498.1 unnamed protein product [Plasmodiophora brassicae]